MLSTRGLRYVLTLVSIGMCGGAVAQFVPLHPGAGYVWSEGMGISDDGAVVGNADTLGDTDYQPWTWTASGGQVFSEIVGSFLGISADGSTIVGQDYANRYAIRLRNNEVERLAANGRAYSASEDGSIVVGTSPAPAGNPQGSLWDIHGNRTLLHQTAQEFATEARTVSRDGSTAVGFGRRAGGRHSLAIWNRDGSRRFTQHSDIQPWGAVSQDGSIVYAVFGSTSPTLHRFTGGSSFEDLGIRFDEVHACTPDGKIVVGSRLLPEGGMQAQIYVQGEGAYELFDWLAMHGVVVSDHVGGFINGIASHDGKLTVTGMSTEQSSMQLHAFVATVPEPNTLIVFAGFEMVALCRRGRKHEACRSKSSLSGDSNRS